jgi:TIR domain-containing protein
MTIAVTDVRGTADHQIAVAAQALGQSSQRRAVFREIHSGKKRIKTVEEIARATALPRKRVLEEAVKLVHKQIIKKTKRDGDTAYERDNFYYVNLKEIFRRADGLGRHGWHEREERRSSVPLKTRRVRTVRILATGRRGPGRKKPKLRLRHYDTFLSHASEDKAAIARPLYRALTRSGVSVWYDEATLTIGDSLRRKIDEGLSRCRFGIVILSPKFFSKDWPQRELDGLVARENASGEKAILPIWHNLSKSQVAKFSPTLADRLAGNSKNGIRSLVRMIEEALAASGNKRRRR